MIDDKKWAQYGYKRQKSDVYGITIHNTNNFEMSAQSIFNWLNDENKGSNGCHFLVDDKEIIDVMPIDWAVYHTGKGNDFGNHYTIAIEICSNLNDGLYMQGQDKAIELIKSLMEEYGITKDRIYFHKDFNNQTYCPATILEKYKSKEEFLDIFFGG